jgi:hypothetical protein
MGTSVAESTLILNSKSIDSMRAVPLATTALSPALASIAEDLSVRSRTELLATLLEREISIGNNAGDIICDIWRSSRGGDRAALRLLVSLLEVRFSGLELLRRALSCVQLFRAFRRAQRGASEYRGDAWPEILEGGQSFAARLGVDPRSLHTLDSSAAIVRRAQQLIDTVLAESITPAELAWLVGLAELEMRATCARLGEMAGRVGDCDGRRISRLLPVLSKQEERIRDTRSLLVKLPDPEDLVKRTPVLAQRLEDRGFDALVREIGMRPEGIEVARALVLTTWRAPLAPELAFFGGIVRLLGDRLVSKEKPPLDPARALYLALLARRPEGLGLELNPMEVRVTTSLWEALGPRPRSGRFLLPWNERKYEPMLPEDGVPELTYPAVRRATDLRALVLTNIGNEQVMSGLLQIPRVAALPGLLEMVVTRSRSVKVLLEIANRRELHTGAANRTVPRALLWHPSGIPLSALRKFVHVRYVERGELATLCGRGSRARPEIRQMVASYLASLSNT